MQKHLISYVLEAIELGLFMIMSTFIVVVIAHPDSFLHQKITEPIILRFLIGIGIGLTALLLIYSPLGKYSGAHFNPAVSITFWRLGKMKGFDCVCYIWSQFLGGLLGVWIALSLFGKLIAHPSVAFIVTMPSMLGSVVAFIAEIVISFLLMIVVLYSTNSLRYNRYTGLFVAGLLVLFITFESPLSGMSMNPARSFASMYFYGNWNDLWIYFTAPLIGMLGAAQIYLLQQRKVYCAKLHHMNNKPCIFRCEFVKLRN